MTIKAGLLEAAKFSFKEKTKWWDECTTKYEEFDLIYDTYFKSGDSQYSDTYSQSVWFLLICAEAYGSE